MKNLTLLFALFVAYFSQAQNMTINAVVTDTNSQSVLPGAVGIVIRVRDSVMVDFKRADKTGRIQMSFPIDTVEFIVRHPQYADYRSFMFGSAENNAFVIDPLAMPEKSTSLGEVVIYANKNPIYYRGDTLVYVADSFKVKENAVVEDLLKKLPGMKVDADGKITNQGKEIGQVLVDGDEFFGNDPTIATKNLAASGVETVQVYEKDSEDGSDEKIQVLDLKLKEEAKKGYFGKINLAGGLDKLLPSNQGFYEGELLLNKFNAKQKIAVFALSSNTPKTDFNGRDLFKFGLSEGFSWGNEGDDIEYFEGNGNGNNDGIPQTFRAGFYLDQKLWKGAKVRLNYSYSQYEVRSKIESLSQYILTDTSYFTDVNNEQTDKYANHSIGVKFTQKIDSTSRIEFEPKITLNTTNQNTNSITDFRSANDTLTRFTDISNITASTGFQTNSTLRYFKDFKKKNRKLTARYNLITNDNRSDGFLNTSDVDASTQTINYSFDQKKENRYTSLGQTGYLNYVEPLSKKWKTEFDYEYYTNSNDQRKTTFTGNNGTYETVDSTFSNQFTTDRQQHRVGAFLIFENAKTRVSFGTRIRNIDIDNRNLFLDTLIKQGLTNVLPRVVFTHKFSQSSRLRIQYNTGSSLPTVDQLQPVPDNTNPNFVRVGNADLEPNYSHTLNANYNMWRGLSGFYTYAGMSTTVQQNAFSTATVYNAFGGTTSQTINVPNATYLNGWAGTGLPIKKFKDVRLDINMSAGYYATESYVNAQRNETQNFSFGPSFDLGYNGDSLNFSVRASMDYNVPSNSLSSLTNQPYTNYNFGTNLDWTLPYRWFIKTDATYTVNTGRTAGYNLNFVIWNASIQRSFLKTGNLYFGIEAYDILNQNISNYRSVEGNVIVDQRTNIIRRYFMAKMTLKFNNNHTKEVEDEGWF